MGLAKVKKRVIRRKQPEVKKKNKSKKDKKRKKEQKHNSSHHIKPTSRRWKGEPKEPAILISPIKHMAWHSLYANLLEEEAILITQSWADEDGTLNKRRLGWSKYLAYCRLFGKDAPPWLALEIIKERSWIY